jgi:hypothetical protein
LQLPLSQSESALHTFQRGVFVMQFGRQRVTRAPLAGSRSAQQA